MNTDEILIMVTLVGLCGLFVGLGVPLALAKVPPNSLYGFRTRQTLEDERDWYPVNRVTGYWCIAMGVLIGATLAVMSFMGESVILAALIVTALTVCGAIGMTVHSLIVCYRLRKHG